MQRQLILEVVGWLGDFVGLCLGLLVAWKLSKNRLRKYAKRLGYPRNREITEARAAREELRRNIPPRGAARTFGIFVSGALVTLALTAILAIHDNQEIVKLRSQLQNTAKYDTWTDVNVLQVYDSWDFLCQFTENGKPYGEPFEMKFAHDGSELKLGLDPGMRIKRIKFENKPDGMSVAKGVLGIVIHRDPATGKFIDFRGNQ